MRPVDPESSRGTGEARAYRASRGRCPVPRLLSGSTGRESPDTLQLRVQPFALAALPVVAKGRGGGRDAVEHFGHAAAGFCAQYARSAATDAALPTDGAHRSQQSGPRAISWQSSLNVHGASSFGARTLQPASRTTSESRRRKFIGSAERRLSYTPAMPLSEVQHQPRAVDALKSALTSGSVHHAWLLHGPEGVGKELAAVCFAQALTCPEKPMEGCGVCSSCKRVKGRNHPDVTWVMPEDEQVQRGLAGRSDFDHTPSRDIRVEQVRALGERLSFRPLEAKHKVALLVNAHAMNAQAQNALLKTLEEPPRDTVLC